MANFDTDAFFSAVKRKDMHDLLAIVFEETGHFEAAKAAKDTTRMTNLAVERIRTALKGKNEGEVIPEPTPDTKDSEKLSYADDHVSSNELVELEKKVKKAIKKGDVKKAKKALKKLKATKLAGNEVEKLEKQIGEMK